nr:hypothetical protein [uncultured Dubosiella sp.]
MRAIACALIHKLSSASKKMCSSLTYTGTCLRISTWYLNASIRPAREEPKERHISLRKEEMVGKEKLIAPWTWSTFTTD